jgi:hypothetical protein
MPSKRPNPPSVQRVGFRATGQRQMARSSILEGVQAHWRETTVGEHGELVLEGLPFEPGQRVEVLVISKTAGSTTAGGRSLLNSVLEFREPLEPVASEDWDALQ